MNHQLTRLSFPVPCVFGGKGGMHSITIVIDTVDSVVRHVSSTCPRTASIEASSRLGAMVCHKTLGIVKGALRLVSDNRYSLCSVFPGLPQIALDTISRLHFPTNSRTQARNTLRTEKRTVPTDDRPLRVRLLSKHLKKIHPLATVTRADSGAESLVLRHSSLNDGAINYSLAIRDPGGSWQPVDLKEIQRVSRVAHYATAGTSSCRLCHKKFTFRNRHADSEAHAMQCYDATLAVVQFVLRLERRAKGG